MGHHTLPNGVRVARYRLGDWTTEVPVTDALGHCIQTAAEAREQAIRRWWADRGKSTRARLELQVLTGGPP